MKILIFGSEGFLGTKLKEVLSKKNLVKGVDIKGGDFIIDVANEKNLVKYFEEFKPEVIINLIALTSSVECEKNSELAKKLNYEAALNILKLAKKFSAKYLFMSSSYVFDGEKGNYSEEDKPNPTNNYAKTKLMAEKELLGYHKSLIIRADLLYGYNGKNFPNSFTEKIISEKEIYVGNSKQIRSPVFIDDLANALGLLILKKESGIFHICGDEKITTLDFFQKLAKKLDKSPKIKNLDEKNLLVKPLINSSLNNSKIKNLIRIKFNTISQGASKIKRQLQ